MDKYRAAIDHLPHRWEKCANSAGDRTEKRTCVISGNNDSVVILYFVITRTIKSYKKQSKSMQNP